MLRPPIPDDPLPDSTAVLLLLIPPEMATLLMPLLLQLLLLLLMLMLESLARTVDAAEEAAFKLPACSLGLSGEAGGGSESTLVGGGS